MTEMQTQESVRPILKDEEDDHPKDRFNQVYWIVFLMGITSMLPWDMLVTVTGYWDAKLADDTDGSSAKTTNSHDEDELNSDQKIFLSYLGIASSLPSCFVYVIHSIYGKRFSVLWKAVTSLIGMIITFTIFIILAYIDTSSWTHTFMIVSLVLAVILNLFRAVFRVTNGSYLGKFPVAYIGSFSNGICMAGLLAVSINIAILGMDVNMEMVGFYTFTFALAVTLISLALFPYMERKTYFRHYSNMGKTADDKDEQVVTVALLKEVGRNCWGYFLALITLGISTNMIYPSATALIEPVNPNDSDFHELYFTQICCFLTWNVCNYIGTASSALIKWPGGTSIRSQLMVLFLAIIRIAFIPYFMFCNLAPTDRSLEVYVQSDVAYVFGIAIFAMSDGYLKNIGMMFGPKTMPVEHQDATASFLVTCLGFSFAIGSLISTPIVNSL